MVRTLPVISLKLFWDRLRPTSPKPLLCFDSHLLVNISRCSSQHLSVISSKHCLCLQLELRPTGTPVRLKNPDYLGLKTQTLPDVDHSLKNVRWGGIQDSNLNPKKNGWDSRFKFGLQGPLYYVLRVSLTFYHFNLFSDGVPCKIPKNATLVCLHF